jgi:ferric iron reductase protein FhuF
MSHHSIKGRRGTPEAIELVGGLTDGESSQDLRRVDRRVRTSLLRRACCAKAKCLVEMATCQTVENEVTAG